MLAIRMRRVGAKKRPFFRMVVTEQRTPRDGAFVEILGHYYPRAKPAKIDVDRERVSYWIAKGAPPELETRTLFQTATPNPRLGPTAIRHDVHVGAAASDIFIIQNGELLVLAGRPPPPNVQSAVRWPFVVGFRLS